MKSLQYKPKIQYQDIDIEKLRPNKSYDYLIQNRNTYLNEIIFNKENLDEFLFYRNCPVCNMDDYRFLYEKDSLNIVKCKNCSVVYVNPIFNEKMYLDIYRSKEYQKIMRGLGEASHLYRKERFGKERMNIIEQFHDSTLPKRLLDIGCSTGFLLEEAQDRDWVAKGIELNPSSAEFARKRNLNVIEKPLQEIKFDENFSVITLFDVLEHLTYPSDILQIVYNLLAPGGRIYIYVPNYNSACKELLGVEEAHFIWPTHHLTYFTPETLNDFLERKNFQVFYWETQGLDLYDWHWYLKEKTDFDTKILENNIDKMQFWINSAGHGKNLRVYARKEK